MRNEKPPGDRGLKWWEWWARLLFLITPSDPDLRLREGPPQVLGPRLGDVSAAEVQEPQAPHPPQAGQARVADGGAAEPQLPQLVQAPQVLQPRVGDVRLAVAAVAAAED